MTEKTPKSLPHAAMALIDPAKILPYLLDPTNPRSRGKPALFFALGYQRELWEQLRDDLLAHGRENPIVRVERQGGATAYSIDGMLIGPNTRTRRIRTVWRHDAGSNRLRLITAFPAPSERMRA